MPALLAVAVVDGSFARSVLETGGVLVVAVGIAAFVGAGLALAAALTRAGASVLRLLTSIMAPLPGVVVLPIALLVFGLGTEAILVATAAGAIWPIAHSLASGFAATSPTLLAVGRSIGLSNARLVTDVRAPAAVPYAVAGLRGAWANAWPTLVGAELVVGFGGGDGGLGTYVANAQHDVWQVVTAVLAIAILGVLVGAGLRGLEQACRNRGFSTM